VLAFLRAGQALASCEGCETAEWSWMMEVSWWETLALVMGQRASGLEAS
jgi:hypothetical protein